MHIGAVWTNLVKIGASLHLVHLGAYWCSLVHLGATQCSLVQLGAVWLNSVQIGAD